MGIKGKRNRGRSGSEEARDIARHWVGLYEEAASEPDGVLYANYQGDLYPYADANDPAPLLDLLRCFADTGYFCADDDWELVRKFELKAEFQDLLRQGKSSKAALIALEKKWFRESRMLERYIKEVGRPPKVNDKS